MAYVIDPSVALAWLLPDETSSSADVIRQTIVDGEKAWIPAHWRLEVGNGLLMAERRGRISTAQADLALSLLDAVPLEKDEETAGQVPGRTLGLARKHGLTLYDAAYLELAQRRAAILATCDNALLKAARKEKVDVAD